MIPVLKYRNDTLKRDMIVEIENEWY
jgi:hypothetical protein